MAASAVRRLGLAFGLLLALAACRPTNQIPPRSIAVPVAVASPTAAPAPVVLPRDDGPHRDLTEWWYYTGHLDAASGESYGFEMVVFQSVRGSGPVGYAAHFAVTDIPRRRFAYDQRTSIGAQIGATPGFDLRVQEWRMAGANGQDRLRAAMPGYAIDLDLRSEKPAALHNGIGSISFGPAGDSYYYSRTRMAVSGSLEVDGQAKPVSGTAWMDHQWGNFISAGGGWEWFSAQLDDRTELTGSIVRDDAGQPVLVYGTAVDAEGRTTHLGPSEFGAETLATWQSPHSGATYPARWRLRTGGPGYDLELRPVLADQELDTRQTTGVVYWEGAVTVTGTRGGVPVAGRGYVELTGFARPTR